MTPSFIGRIVVIPPGVRPSICLASVPTAATVRLPEPERSWRTATTDGSLSTMPCPRTKMRVLAVPRSIDRALENRPRNFLNIGGECPGGMGDRKGVVSGKSGSIRGDLVGSGILKKKKTRHVVSDQ